MAAPRVRDFVSFLTSLPAAMTMLICLVIPHTKDCQRHVETPIESGTWLAIVPMIVIGLLPVAWRAWPAIRDAVPELLLMMTLIAMALFVVTIPVGIYLMWGYAKRSFRGEVLAAMCCTACATMFALAYPVITMFATWLPGAHLTWGAALVEIIGFAIWTSAAVTRTRQQRETFPRRWADDRDTPNVLIDTTSSHAALSPPDPRRDGRDHARFPVAE